MFCPNCGSVVDDGANICSVCGTKITPQNQPNDVRTNGQDAGWQTRQPEQELPMKWFKFLIYFSLWLGGVVNILSSVQYFTGAMYENAGGSAELVYLVFPSLKTVDVLYGLIGVATGIFAIYTRYRLAGFRKNGPKCLYLTYGVQIVAVIGYALLRSGVIDNYSTLPNAIGFTVGAVLMIVLNRIYFNKRSSLFVN